MGLESVIQVSCLEETGDLLLSTHSTEIWHENTSNKVSVKVLWVRIARESKERDHKNQPIQFFTLLMTDANN